MDFIREIEVGQSRPDAHIAVANLKTILGGHHADDSQHQRAAQKPISDAGQASSSIQSPTAIIGETVAYYGRYIDLRRAKQRLELQGMAMCRSLCGGDKTEGAKLYKKPTPDVEIWLEPYSMAMAPLDARIKDHEKHLTKLGGQFHVKEWLDSVSGLSPRFLAMIVGEAGTGPGDFKSVSALWKRMGLAVINGERQRRVTGDMAIIHGYVARRRSLMWNIGESIIKQQVRNPKGEDGKPLGDAQAIGYFGQVYLERKAYELARADDITPILAHNRAKRYMEKRLLRELWKAWRK